MAASEWRLLASFTDLPSAHSLAQVLAAQGVVVRIMSDAGVLGQAAPAHLFVDAAHYAEAGSFLAHEPGTEEELGSLASGAPEDSAR
jgi:hypothetical protein